ncbi:alpha-tocopherol transfer protein-like [Trichonephila inaurata madagascariensis]|uniref:Alpha-tocopherol transfer protein-like n=1 Tax=Trichonephila inaurata madagascariensis TaxID=2747483 RepID=A0A8X7BWE6_9ARAC|nr:alpha-tocopherol transfer protein-like [Trichonephila inaurata madagascariensis]
MDLIPFWQKTAPEVIKSGVGFGRNTMGEEHFARLRKLIVSVGEEGFEIPTDESFLLRFLRAKKYDANRSFKCLKNYYHLKSTYPEMFNKTPLEVKDILEKNIYYVTKKRGYEGKAFL